MWNPWRVLRDLVHVDLSWVADLDRPDQFGETTFGPPPKIRMVTGQTQAQRRSTLAHELVHLERGTSHVNGCDLREEARVELEAARRLITWEALVDALVWSGNEHEVAEQLHVDVDIVTARLRALTDAEGRALVRLLEHAELRNP